MFVLPGLGKGDVIFIGVVLALITVFAIFGMYSFFHWFLADFSLKQTWVCR